MSNTVYFIEIARNAVKALVDRSNTSAQSPQVYQALMSNLFNPSGSPLLSDLIQTLDSQTNNTWRNGISQENLFGLLRPWTVRALDHVARSLQGQQGYGQPNPQYGGQQGYGSPHVMSPTNGIYDSTPVGIQQPPHPVVAAPGNFSIPQAQLPGQSPDYERGTPVMFELYKASNAEFQQPVNGILKISEYATGEYDNARMLTAEVTVRTTQNTAIDAGRLVFYNAPQEVIRGTFADVIFYSELFHVPVGFVEFSTVADAVWEAFAHNNWRAAMQVLNARTKGEWDIMNRVLCRLLNDLIYRKLRATQPGVSITGIESVEDLVTLDDRNADFAVVKHKEYWSTFNNIVNTAIEALFNPDNRIGPEDENFGDFISCNAVNYYENGHSKYDYGVFKEAIDRRAFIDKMMAKNTVIRISRAAILTNALDARLVSRVKSLRSAEQVLLHTINSVGTALINKLEYPKRGDVERVVCMQHVNGVQTYDVISIGRSLDHDLLLLA